MNEVHDVEDDRKTQAQIDHEPYRTPQDRVVADERPAVIVRRGGLGAWLFGAVCGAIIAVAGYAYFAHQQGSYQAAGAAVDTKVATSEQSVGRAAQNTGDAAKAAGDKAEATLK